MCTRGVLAVCTRDVHSRCALAVCTRAVCTRAVCARAVCARAVCACACARSSPNLQCSCDVAFGWLKSEFAVQLRCGLWLAQVRIRSARPNFESEMSSWRWLLVVGAYWQLSLPTIPEVGLACCLVIERLAMSESEFVLLQLSTQSFCKKLWFCGGGRRWV